MSSTVPSSIPELIIFDCDGVLVDSELLANRVLSEFLSELGIAMSAEQAIERFVGRPSAEVSLYLAKLLRTDILQRFDGMLSRRERAAFERRLRAMRGIKRVLGSLRAKMCVASSSTRSALRLKLRHTGLLGFFGNRIFSTDMVAHGKPHPDLFLLAAKQCGVAPGRCLVIEDSVPGIQAAKTAGMSVWGFVGGSHCTPRYRRSIALAAPSLIFDDMTRMTGLLRGGGACASRPVHAQA